MNTDPVELLPPPPFRNPATGNPYPAAMNWRGLPVLIENTRRSVRRGVGEDGERWESEMPDHYGEVYGTVAADGDALDVFVGPDAGATHVYVVAIAHMDGTFDEVKAMLDYRDRDAAMRALAKAYDDKLRIIRVTDWLVADFIARCRRGDVGGDWRHGRGSRRGFNETDLRHKACDLLGVPRDTAPEEVRRLSQEHIARTREALKARDRRLGSEQGTMFGPPTRDVGLVTRRVKVAGYHRNGVWVPEHYEDRLVRPDTKPVATKPAREQPPQEPGPLFVTPTPPAAPSAPETTASADPVTTPAMAPEPAREPWQTPKNAVLWFERKQEVPLVGEYVQTKDGPRQVLASKSRYFRDDAMSFGAPGGLESGHRAELSLAAVSAEDRASHLVAQAAKSEAQRRDGIIRAGLASLRSQYTTRYSIPTSLVGSGHEYELENRGAPSFERRALVRADDGSWWELSTGRTQDDARQLTSEGAALASKLVAELGVSPTLRTRPDGTDERREQRLREDKERADAYDRYLEEQNKKEIEAVPAALALAQELVPSADVRFDNGRWSVRADGFDGLREFTREGDRMVAPLYNAKTYRGERATSGGSTIMRDGVEVPEAPGIVGTLQRHMAKREEAARKQAAAEAAKEQHLREKQSQAEALQAVLGKVIDRVSPAVRAALTPELVDSLLDEVKKRRSVMSPSDRTMFDGFWDGHDHATAASMAGRKPVTSPFDTDGWRMAKELADGGPLIDKPASRSPAPAPPAAAPPAADDFTGSYGGGGSVRVSRSGNSWLVSGNTFPIKDDIKAHGARWDPDARAWRIPHERAVAAGEKLRSTLHRAPAFEQRPMRKCTVDVPRLVELLRAKRKGPDAHPAQLGLFGGDLVPKRVTVAAHTTTEGVHVPQHNTTVYVKREEPAAHSEAQAVTPPPAPAIQSMPPTAPTVEEMPPMEPEPTPPPEPEPQPELQAEEPAPVRTTTRTVLAQNLPKLQAKVAELTRRALRLGLAPPVLTVGEAYTRTRTISEPDPFSATGSKERDITETVHDATLTAPHVKAPGGWTMAGTLTPVEGAGNLVQSLPGEPELPARFATHGAHCDHCQTKRDRKMLYVFRSPSGYKQVGGSCLQEFAGIDPHNALAAAQYLREVRLDQESEEWDGWAGGGEREVLPDIHDCLTLAAYSVDRYGFHPSESSDSTVAHVEAALFQRRNRDRLDLPSPEKRVMAAAKATQIIAWARALPEDGSQYLRNIRMLAHAEQLPTRGSLALLVSAVNAYDTAMGHAAMAAASKPFGAPGDKIGSKAAKGVTVHPPVNVKCTRYYVEDGTYGTTYYVTLQDNDGHVFLWRTSTPHFSDGPEKDIPGIQPGMTFTIDAANIKEHREYRGVRQAVLTHTKLSLRLPEAEREAVEKELRAAKEQDELLGRTGGTDSYRRGFARAESFAAQFGGVSTGAQDYHEYKQQRRAEERAAYVPGRHVFTAVTHADMDHISQHGLTPASDLSLRRSLGEDTRSTIPQDHVVLAENPNSTRMIAENHGPSPYGNIGETEAEHRHRAVMVVRTPRPEGLKERTPMMHGKMVTSLPEVPPDRLEFYHPASGWTPVRQFDPAVHDWRPAVKERMGSGGFERLTFHAPRYYSDAHAGLYPPSWAAYHEASSGTE